MGYVVHDVEQAIKHWVEVCGIGPWYYVDKLPVKDFHYRVPVSYTHLKLQTTNYV